MNLLRRKLKYFIIVILIITADLYTKYFAATSLEFGQSFKVNSFLNFTLLYNNGAAFSLLSSDKTSWQVVMLALISLIAAITLSYLIIKRSINEKLSLFSFSLILGGTLGNFYGRAFRGYVIDFLDFHIKNYHWPSFNIADSSITCGVILLILTLVSSSRS